MIPAARVPPCQLEEEAPPSFLALSDPLREAVFGTERRNHKTPQYLPLLSGSFTLALAAKVNAARIDEHAESLQLVFSWWVHLPGLTRIKRPTGVAHYVFYTDTWEDHVEFENACRGITAHDA